MQTQKVESGYNQSVHQVCMEGKGGSAGDISKGVMIVMESSPLQMDAVIRYTVFVQITKI